MARRQEDQLHDKMNGVIGYMRSSLSSLSLALQLELLEAAKRKAESGESVDPEQFAAVRSFGDELVKRFRQAMPMMKPDEE